MRSVTALLVLRLASSTTSAFTVPPPGAAAVKPVGSSATVCNSRLRATTSNEADSSFVDALVSNVKQSAEIVQKSSAAGSSFKQIIADVLAGEYDVDAVNAKLDELIASAPAVMFIWEASPFSKKAIRAMEMIGADVKIVRLDDPWDEGNPLRAELGRKTGRTSVPCIFIGGEYVGGYDGGVGEESPGIVDLAFQGKLLSKLEAAGALKAKE
mmetsp:Transcript_2679/g.6191  ORF Transcript_2679/g.6191 Transcript_2679/m.6191 type:complete len:212 (+) Transcript_2679:195-830(+)